MADEDVTAERARLEALAWGAGSSPEDAERARRALHDLDADGPDAEGARSPGRDPDERASDPTTARPRRADVYTVPPATVGRPPVASSAAADRGSALPASSAGTASSGPEVRGGSEASTDPEAGSVGGAERDGGDPGLPSDRPTWRTRAHGLLWTARPRAWIALGAAAVMGLAFAAGTLVGTTHEQQAAAPSVTPSPGTVTLEELLDIPQTYADQLPGPIGAPVSLRTTRLVFTNRALDGSAFETPWNVWAGVGTDRSTICLIATANRLESTTACYPRDDALHGNVSLSAQSTSGTLTLTLRGGGVQGTVTNEN